MREKGKNIVATKITQDAAKRLESITARLNLTKYSFLQTAVNMLIRLMDEPAEFTDEQKQIYLILDDLQKRYDREICADDITEITMYAGSEATHVWTKLDKQTKNVQIILERFLCLTIPRLYRLLRILAAERGCKSILQMLTVLCLETLNVSDAQEIREMFADNSRSETGRTPAATPYKRKKSRPL